MNPHNQTAGTEISLWAWFIPEEYTGWERNIDSEDSQVKSLRSAFENNIQVK